MKTMLKAAVLTVAGALTLTACASADGGSSAASDTTIGIYGFAVPQAANEAIEAEFKKTAEGKGVSFIQSYGASGDQSRKVADTKGKDVDYVHFSLEPDVTRLVDAGLVADDWNSGPTKGIVSSSVAVIAVKKGNPLGIKDWSDLTKPGVKVVTADPASSGSARWNVLALYSAAKDRGATGEQADTFLEQVFSNVTSWAASGREATEAFKKGVGNVLITYENEAILAKQNGEDLDYIVPDSTFLIENPGAVLKDADPVATKWLDFVLSDKGQAEFVKKGFRPVGGFDASGIEVEGANDPADPFPTPGKLTTIADLGGWSAVNKEWFGKDGVKLRFDRLYAKATQK